MFAQQHQSQSLDLISGPLPKLEQQQSESGEKRLLEDRLTSLQQCICELLLENERLRMRLYYASSPLRAVCSVDLEEI
jgi:hypothetical protein